MVWQGIRVHACVLSWLLLSLALCNNSLRSLVSVLYTAYGYASLLCNSTCRGHKKFVKSLLGVSYR